ncbi:muscarinic acetylcholine receptor M2 isoform 2-T4 [Liasis olivaceus]
MDPPFTPNWNLRLRLSESRFKKKKNGDGFQSAAPDLAIGGEAANPVREKENGKARPRSPVRLPPPLFCKPLQTPRRARRGNGGGAERTTGVAAAAAAAAALSCHSTPMQRRSRRATHLLGARSPTKIWKNKIQRLLLDSDSLAICFLYSATLVSRFSGPRKLAKNQKKSVGERRMKLFGTGLQTLSYLGWSSLDALQFFNALPKMQCSELDAIFQMWSDKQEWRRTVTAI